ncbi:VOC family protein [Hoeflea poritis]|uniref:VOC family protein n=1 Tax=Hoeflea poritis TaxID=2993659 RepID=A0ABT4VKF6_9HYPH|nr:VOC family protein [Hoeflea poritis]MDA4845194.1 VOC family protein [Hoeflea poritis]
MQAPGHVLETALYARDLDAAERFYGEFLGLEKVTRMGDRHVFFRCGRGMVLIFNPDESIKPPQNPAMPVPVHGAIGEGHLCFGATDKELEAIEKTLVSANVEIEADFRWPGGGRSIYVRDPAGNSIEFAEPRIWGFGGQ